jgi:hypothetical protein
MLSMKLQTPANPRKELQKNGSRCTIQLIVCNQAEKITA